MNTYALKAVEINDARLEGRINRAEWAVQIAALDAEITAAGLTWEGIQS